MVKHRGLVSVGRDVGWEVEPVRQSTDHPEGASAWLLANELPFPNCFREVKVIEMLGFVAPIFQD